MFNLHDYIMACILGMVHKEADYKVREYSLGWYQKGVLNETDLATIETAIATQEFVEEQTEELTEEPME